MKNLIDTENLSKEWTVTNDGDAIVLKHNECTLYVHDFTKESPAYGYDGSTRFKNSEGHECSFDRIGVEASFSFGGTYGSNKDKPLSIIAEEQLKRVRDHLARIKEQGGFVDVPDTNGKRVTKAALEDYKKTLQGGEHVTLSPRGFGTAYIFHSRRLRYGKPATAEQKKFFGVSQLFVETQDWD